MEKRKLLTVEDLLRFCHDQGFSTFSSKKTGYKLAVQIPTHFDIIENDEDNHRGMLKLKFRIFHDGLNRNGSYVSRKSADAAAPTISDRPILAAIHQLDDGSYDFEAHEMEIIENENGEREVNYIEKQVGSFSSETPFWEYDEELDKNFLCAYGYIAEDYTRAADIIRSKNGTKNSCELLIEEMAYNAKDNYLELKKFYVSASTLLGKRKDGTPINEGMLGSRADIADFSVENNSLHFEQDSKTIEIMQELKQTLDNYITAMAESKKGEPRSMDNFEENVEVTETSDSEVVKEQSEESEKVEETTTEKSTEEVAVTEASSEETSDVAPSEDETSAEVFSKTITYSVSVSEMLSALTNLVNETYSGDGTYYMVDCYTDSKELVMIDMWSGNAYKQSYSVKKDVYSLKGDRVAVHARYLTSDEEAELDRIKGNYSTIENELNLYRAEPEKLEILGSEEYSQIKETEEYKELAKRESYFELDKEDLAKKLDEIILAYAKANKLDFAKVESEEAKPQVGMKPITMSSKKSVTGRYGSLFAK